MLIYGADVNFKDEDNDSPLVLMTKYLPRNLKFIRLLIIFGAHLYKIKTDMSVNTKQADSAISQLQQTLDDKTLNIFFGYRYLLSQRKFDGKPLIVKPSIDVLKVLIKHKVNINAQDIDGWTLIRWIIELSFPRTSKSKIKQEKKALELIKFLLNNGARDYPDNRGFTAKGAAAGKGFDKIVALLD